MERPKIATVLIQWIDKEGNVHSIRFSETTLEEAHDFLGLMIGDLCEADLES